MLKSIFLLFVCLFVCTRTVFSQWQFAVTTQGKIVFFDEQWTEVTTAAHQFEELLAITFDEIDERIYFNDHRHNKSSIFSLKLPLGKGNPHIIEDTIARTQNERVVAMDYDPLNRNIFWTDANNKKIYFYSIDADKGSKPKVLFDFADEETTPDGISIDICRRKLYWTSSNLANPSVHRASLNGQDHEVLINSSLYFPHGITVDQLSDRIYYVVDQPGIHYTVESAKLDGTDRQILVKDINNMPFSLTVTRDSVYWTDLAHKAVWKIPKINSTDNHPIKVKSFDSPVRGIVSRLGILTRLKSDQGCKSVIQKIEQLMSTRNNQTGNRNKIEENNEMVCLGNGLYSEANSACACNAGYSGARCETYDCNNFCVHGTCKIEDGFPTCTCQIGFTGERCQTSKCSNFCLNDGHCTIEDNEPVCDCSNEMFGERCESNSTETCAPFCMLIRKDIEVDMPYYCYRVCRNLHPSDENIQRMKRPDELCRSSWNKSVIVIVCGVLVALLLIYLTILALRRIYKPLRPRIKKTIVLQKKISPTPLTCRPIATEQCEITIEDCCNSTVCETPCFDPKLLQKSMDDAKKQAKEDRAILIDNMENEIY